MTNSDPKLPSIKIRDYVETLVRHERELTTAKFDAVALAVEKAEKTMNHRLEGMNEFRHQLESQKKDFVTRQELRDGLERRLEIVEKSSAAITTKASVIWAVVLLIVALAGVFGEIW